MNTVPYKAVGHSYLEYVVSRWDVSDVDPLTVYVGVICIIATRTEPLKKTQTYITSKYVSEIDELIE